MQFVLFLQAVVRRPTMYTLRGSFEEVACFIEGYVSGVAKSTNPHAQQQLAEWITFLNWLAVELNTTKGSWLQLVAHIRHDTDRFALLEQKLEEYLAESQD